MRNGLCGLRIVRLAWGALVYMGISFPVVAADTPREPAIERALRDANARDQAVMELIRNDIEVIPTHDKRLNGTTFLIDGVVHYRPADGDRLGFGREESEKLLSREVRNVLDGVSRIHREPGLFVDRVGALKAIGVETTSRRWFESVSRSGYKQPYFVEDFVSGPLTAMRGWSGQYFFSGSEEGDIEWRVRIEIALERESVCVSSKAVEGYLDLALKAAIQQTLPHPMNPFRWNRHGSFGQPWSESSYHKGPRIQLIFSASCLVKIVLAGKYSET